MTSCTGSARGGFWGFWKSRWIENLTPNEKGRLSGLAEARRICALRAPHEMGGRWKNQNRKNVYLSPYVEEPLNSKVIKSFVPEQRSRKCFSCFGIPMFYVYMLWTFYDSFKNLTYTLFVDKTFIFNICIKQDLAWNNLQGLICHKTQTTLSHYILNTSEKIVLSEKYRFGFFRVLLIPQMYPVLIRFLFLWLIANQPSWVV